MKINTKVEVGGVVYEFQIDQAKEMDALHQAIVLSNPPRFCNECKNPKDFKLDSNKDKDGNIYVNICCQNPSCFAKAKLGQYKSGGYFWHRFERYIKQDSQSGTAQATTTQIPKKKEDVLWE